MGKVIKRAMRIVVNANLASSEDWRVAHALAEWSEGTGLPDGMCPDFMYNGTLKPACRIITVMFYSDLFPGEDVATKVVNVIHQTLSRRKWYTWMGLALESLVLRLPWPPWRPTAELAYPIPAEVATA